MVDESLRALERSLAEGAATPTRLRYARELERRGDVEGALDVLLAASDDATIREEITRYPAWTHSDGGPGHTRWVDVRPARTEPKVKWIAEEPAGALLASPLGVVSHSQGTRLALIDPVSGETRASVPRRYRWDMPGSIVGQAYVTAQPDEEAIDLLTGRRLWRQKAADHASLQTHELLVRLARKSNALEATARTDSRRPPKKRAWRWPTKGPLPGGLDGTLLVAGGGAVVLAGSPRFVALDARTGAERFQGDGWSVLADERGLLVHDEGALSLLDHEGAVRWRKKGYSQLEALAPGFAVARKGKRQLVLVDRKSGERIAALPAGLVLLAIAQDVLYLHEPERIYEARAPRLSAYDAEGRRLWRFEFAPRQGLAVTALAPMPGRVLVGLRSHVPNRTESFVVCFEG